MVGIYRRSEPKAKITFQSNPVDPVNPLEQSLLFIRLCSPMEKSNVSAIIWQEDDVYVSKSPELEVASAGDTQEEALENLKEAIELYLENAKAMGISNDFASH